MITSKNTSINKNKVPKAFTGLIKMLPYFTSISTTFDIGGGKYDTATDYLKQYGIKNVVYDPHNRSNAHNDTSIRIIKDTPKNEVLGIISNVLNVIPDSDERISLLKLSDQFSVATIITIYEGNKTGIGRITKTDCWQENRVFKSYYDEISSVFDKIIIRYGMYVALNLPLTMLLEYGINQKL